VAPGLAILLFTHHLDGKSCTLFDIDQKPPELMP
jgi:hypothetical protein